MGHFDLHPNFFGGQPIGLQKYCAAAHTKSMAITFAKALFQLQTLLVCQIYNFYLCDSRKYFCI